MSETIRARYFLFALTAFSYAIVFPLAAAVGLGIDYESLAKPIALALSFTVSVSLVCRWRGIPSLRASAESVGVGVLLTFPVLISTYVAMRANMPLADQKLIAMDQHLGIDWHSVIRFVDLRPYLAVPLTLAYTSFGPQLLLIPALLAIAGRMSRSYQMVAAYGVVCFISSIIAVWYPAFGAYIAFDIDHTHLNNINGYFAYSFADQLQGVRNDPAFIFDFAKASGLVTFPSVHAAAAALCAWAAWDLKWMRYPAGVLNAMMLVSAVTEGGHYVVDLIAGIGVAGFSIAMVLLVTRADPRTRTLRDIAGKGAHSPSISLD